MYLYRFIVLFLNFNSLLTKICFFIFHVSELLLFFCFLLGVVLWIIFSDLSTSSAAYFHFCLFWSVPYWIFLLFDPELICPVFSFVPGNTATVISSIRKSGHEGLWWKWQVWEVVIPPAQEHSCAWPAFLGCFTSRCLLPVLTASTLLVLVQLPLAQAALSLVFPLCGMLYCTLGLVSFKITSPGMLFLTSLTGSVLA